MIAQSLKPFLEGMVKVDNNQITEEPIAAIRNQVPNVNYQNFGYGAPRPQTQTYNRQFDPQHFNQQQLNQRQYIPRRYGPRQFNPRQNNQQYFNQQPQQIRPHQPRFNQPQQNQMNSNVATEAPIIQRGPESGQMQTGGSLACFKCGGNHLARHCNVQVQGCYNCGGPHYARQCPLNGQRSPY